MRPHNVSNFTCRPCPRLMGPAYLRLSNCFSTLRRSMLIKIHVHKQEHSYFFPVHASQYMIRRHFNIFVQAGSLTYNTRAQNVVASSSNLQIEKAQQTLFPSCYPILTRYHDPC